MRRLDLIAKRRKKYLESQKKGLLVEDATRIFFRNVKAFQAKERPKAFDVRVLFPGKDDVEVAEELAAFFNKISHEFSPLEPSQIPRTHDRALPRLSPFQVAGRIRAFKKPKSMVRGDIFPSLLHRYADLLAVPLTDIYNEITETSVWPRCWKQEFVTVIPKCRNPTSLSDLRNISCTMLASKIYESYVLNWLATEVSYKNNQYGGVKGCSVGHLLVDLWDEITMNLEDARAATMITAIDYAKAFNRLSFQHCLEAFARKGASTQSIAILATFLSNRTMTVRVSDTWSRPLPVYGGVPQGSILGVMLFNIATDDLEDDSEYVSDPGAPTPEIEEAFHHAPADAPDEEAYLRARGYPEALPEASADDTFYSACSDQFSPTGVFASSPGGPELNDATPSPVRAVSHDGLRPTMPGIGSQRRVVYSSEEDVTPPPEPTRTCLGPWKAGLVDVDKYVDDNLQEEKISMENAPRVMSTQEELRCKHAVATQNVFRHVVRAAEKKGMRVNASKTNMLCISDSLNFKASCFI